MKGLEYKSLPFTLREASEDGGEFEGLASAFYCIDDSWWNDIVAPGAFAPDLPLFLSEGFVGGMNHDWDQPIGRPLSAEETKEGLAVRASICDTAHGRDVRTLMREGVVRRLSIGFRVLGRRYLETAGDVMAWWNEVGYVPTAEDVAKSQFGARLLTRIRLYEFSPVAVPANRRAVITGVKTERESGGVGERERSTTFEMHSEHVLTELGEYLERVRALRELRGRDLSPNHRTGFRRLEQALQQILEGPAQEPGASRGSKAREQARGLYEQFRQICRTDD